MLNPSSSMINEILKFNKKKYNRKKKSHSHLNLQLAGQKSYGSCCPIMLTWWYENIRSWWSVTDIIMSLALLPSWLIECHVVPFVPWGIYDAGNRKAALKEIMSLHKKLCFLLVTRYKINHMLQTKLKKLWLLDDKAKMWT